MSDIQHFDTLFRDLPTLNIPPSIKSCPFCGARAEVTSLEFGDYQTIYFRVQCSSNSYHSLDCWDDSEIEAIQTWNERPNKTSCLQMFGVAYLQKAFGR